MWEGGVSYDEREGVRLYMGEAIFASAGETCLEMLRSNKMIMFSQVSELLIMLLFVLF